MKKSYSTFLSLIKSDPIKEKTEINGILVHIEWPKGSVRTYKHDGELKDGKKQTAGYGYFPGTTSPDGEELDCYLGDNLDSAKVFLLMQKPTPWDIEHGFEDPEEKWMLGFDSIDEARQVYVTCMPSKWFMSIEESSYEDLSKKLKK